MKNKFVDFKVLAASLCCSVVMGLISFAFLKCLDYAADFRSFFPLCYIFLPVAGIVTAFAYKRIGGKSSMGNNIIIESANDGEKVPKRLASLTFIFTCITHLFGGSVGREGTAVQIGGSLTSNVADYLGFKNNDRSTIVLSGISSAFGSVFGTPFAGAFFGMEVCCVGRLSAGAVIPCFACSYLANFVTQLLGFKHERYATLQHDPVKVFRTTIPEQTHSPPFQYKEFSHALPRYSNIHLSSKTSVLTGMCLIDYNGKILVLVICRYRIKYELELMYNRNNNFLSLLHKFI